MDDLKVKTKNITQKELEELYSAKLMTLDQIGQYYGFSDRQLIIRLFKNSIS